MAEAGEEMADSVEAEAEGGETHIFHFAQSGKYGNGKSKQRKNSLWRVKLRLRRILV